jgi:hypothetical protein
MNGTMRSSLSTLTVATSLAFPSDGDECISRYGTLLDENDAYDDTREGRDVGVDGP